MKLIGTAHDASDIAAHPMMSSDYHAKVLARIEGTDRVIYAVRRDGSHRELSRITDREWRELHSRGWDYHSGMRP